MGHMTREQLNELIALCDVLARGASVCRSDSPDEAMGCVRDAESDWKYERGVDGLLEISIHPYYRGRSYTRWLASDGTITYVGEDDLDNTGDWGPMHGSYSSVVDGKTHHYWY